MSRLLRPLTAAAAFLLLALLAGCGGGETGSVRLLVDGEHAPDTLVEDHEIARPPALGGNRFLTGWWPSKASRKDRQVRLQPVPPRARLQIVHLGNRPRTLILDLLQPPEAPTKVRVTAAGRDLGAFPVADPTEILLPGDLPEGRVNVDLAFEPGISDISDIPDIRVLAAAIRPSLPSGKVGRRGADLIQSGESMVDMVRPVTEGTVLTGTFVPPRGGRPDQRFELTVLLEDGSPVRHFSWSPSFWNRLLGEKSIRLPLGQARGWVRIRLRSHGQGPAAVWKRLALSGTDDPEAAAPPVAAEEVPFPQPRLVIVYVMDALRADVVGALGGPRGVSPTWDRMAREGMLFRNHRSVAPNTIPSTKSFFTGHAFVFRGGWKLLPEDGPTLAEMYRAAGYHTGVFSGNVYVSPAYGTDRGFEKVAEDVLIDGDGYAEGEARTFNDNAARVHAAALSWLATLPRGAKAFLYIHTIHPHNPYDPPEPLRSRFTAGIASTIDGETQTLTDIKQKRRKTTRADRGRLRGLYLGSLAYNDGELAGFLAKAGAWAPPGESLVALTADHGEELFDHGGILHGFTLFEEQLHIPLLLWAPGRLKPAVVDERTDTLDLHATLVQLCGLRGPDGKPAASDGRLLLRVARGEVGDYVHLAAASSVRGGIFSALHGHWKVVWAPRTGASWGQGDSLGRSREPEYLFDLEKDPAERVNLAGDGGLEAAWLRSRLLAWVEKHRAESKGKDEQPVDKKTLERLKALGYVS